MRRCGTLTLTERTPGPASCNMRVVVVLFVVVALMANNVHANASDGIFTSNADLQSVLTTNGELINELREYVRDEELRLQRVKRYLALYESLSEAGSADPEVFVGNPINAYVLIKRLTSDWRDLRELMTSSVGKNTVERVVTSQERLRWPTDEDLNGAAVGLFRLQDTYVLRAEDVAGGVLNGLRYGEALSAHDCFELGRQAYNAGDHRHSTAWMAQALAALDRGKDEAATSMAAVSRADVVEYLAYSSYLQGNVRRALRLTEDLLRLDPEHPRAQGNKVYYLNALEESGGKEKKKGEDGLGDAEEPFEVLEKPSSEEESILPYAGEKKLYERLCRGEQQLTEDYRSKLGCRYIRGFHPFLNYAPHKEEEVFLDPRIVIYHGVLSDEEIALVKTLAAPKFKRATVQNYKTGELETASYRISKTAWLNRNSHQVIDRIYQRVGDVTGLNMETSEELQVSHYGIGGHYEPHFDFARREERHAFENLGTGNRIATWLFYESEVAQGGATVFPTLGIGLWPVKGAAVFWYNLHRNGEGDDRTRHAACPVLVGNKWVSNFWIHERGQELTRPCNLSPFE